MTPPLDPLLAPRALAALPPGPAVPAQVPPGLPGGPPGRPTGLDLLASTLTGAVGAFLTTLVVGAILVAVAPDYVDRTAATLLDRPLGSFVYGLASLALVILATVLLAITIVGLLVAIPLAIVSYVVWAVGAAIGFLAVGRRLLAEFGSGGDGAGAGDATGSPFRALLVGAGLNGLLTLTGVGGLIAFAVGAAGFGAVLRDWLA